MLLRKSRKHLHGSSNRVNTDAPFHSSFYKPYSHTKKDNLIKNQPTSTTSYLKYRKLHKKQNSFNHHNLHTLPQESDFQPTEIECKLRKMYQGKKNIVKAINSWGFDSKGFITIQIFKQKLKQKLGFQPSEQQVFSLLHKFSNNQKGINAQQFISLIHKKTQGSMFNQTLFPFHQNNQLRDRQIDDLKQNLKVYTNVENTAEVGLEIDQLMFKINSSISKIRHNGKQHLLASKEQFFDQLLQCSKYGNGQKKLIRTIENLIDYEELKYNIQTHKTVDHIFLDPILRKSHINIFKSKEGDQGDDLFLDRMIKKSAKSYKLLRNSQKKEDYDPKTMLNINQQKTRFGKHFFIKEKHDEIPFTLHQGVSPNQKDLVLKTLKSQSDIQKQRYANKLQRIRQFHENQKSSIATKQQNAVQKEECRLMRIRNEQQAYNYVNFIKKKWE